MIPFRRLIRTDLGELVGRGRQEIYKWLDRRDARERLRAPRVRRQFAAIQPGHFFSGVAAPSAGADVARTFPEARRTILDRAESAHGGWFDLLGYRNLWFGDPVDWHLDPVSGRRSELDYWSRLDPLDPAACGDVKVVWELNRHQWLLYLAQAYAMTGDERHAAAVVSLMRGWMRANPPGRGINWASSLELSLRLISWCWLLRLLGGSRALSGGVDQNIVGWLALHAAHVQRYPSYYSSPNTHLTAEGLGLFYAGVLFPEIEGAERWKRLGARILVDEVDRQVLDDGVYFEQSICYQRYTVDIYLHFLILARLNGTAVPDRVAERVQLLLDFLLAIRSPDGTLPQIGDNDGGSLLPLLPRRPADARATFAVAAAWFGRADYAWAASGATPEVLWLLGRQGLATLDGLAPAPPSRQPSQIFPEGGYAVMRSAWDTDAHQLIFDVGPLGCPISSGHGHADLLSVQCSTFGEPCLVDAGVSSYAANTRWRNAFRETAMHSTVVVDGESQAVPSGPFAWRDRPRARLRRWVSEPCFDYADAEHDAYHRLEYPVHHRRRILFVKPRYWIIVDDLTGMGVHQVELRFQFGPVQVRCEDSPWIRALGPSRIGLALGTFGAEALVCDVRSGVDDPIEGWTAADYGAPRPAPVVVYSVSGVLPIRLASVLWPSQGVAPDGPPATLLLAQPPGLQLQCGQDLVHIGDDVIRLCTPEMTHEVA